ncbi:MAG TPA: protein phosphatase 2C domain-containing protein [Gemmatimonadales bacterium]|jgi:protein phosphatase|nr:protein phosphatase 2C domain-containing protein [Gemmatimonadales bacterium]
MVTGETQAQVVTGQKPRDDQLEIFALTHPGKVRKTNQDHFLVCALKRRVDVHLSSLPDASELTAPGDRLAFLAMVADGVGSSLLGEEASRRALERVTQYLAQSINCYYTADTADDSGFSQALENAAMQVHSELADEAARDPERRGMATTLTLLLGDFPRGYLLQVGDSRAYLLRDGKLAQITRDQTMAQELIDLGVLKPADAPGSRWASMLSSSIGGSQSAPVVSRIEERWGDVGMLCSDGLTRHVPDERIKERLSSREPVRAICEGLLQDALDAGGADNITIVVVRVAEKR